MAAHDIVVLISDHPFTGTALFLLILITVASLAVAAHVSLRILKDARRERRRQQRYKRASISVWLGRPS
jgi:hypothetical protein